MAILVVNVDSSGLQADLWLNWSEGQLALGAVLCSLIERGKRCP